MKPNHYKTIFIILQLLGLPGLLLAQTSYNGNSVPITGTGNAAFGAGLKLTTFGNNNTAMGFNALLKNTEGANNAAGGYNALLLNTSGTNNTAFGSESLDSNMVGFNNTANGFRALHFSKLGFENTAVGAFALYSNNNGYSNTAIGEHSLLANTGGFANTAAGGLSMNGTTIGSYNTTAGYQSLYANSGGSYNVAIGNAAGLFNNGNNNLFLGNRAGYREKTATQKLYIASDSIQTILYGDFSTGQILMGVPDPSNYTFKGNRKLNVVGGIITDSIRVALSGTWADHVLYPAYKLTPLHDVEAYIKAKRHLPNIPSVDEVTKYGIDIALMNAKLLEKVEELYLYVIQQQKEIDRLKQKFKGNEKK
jgi:hypothetical protein